jgi:transposase
MGNRRQYSAEFKAKIVLQALTGEKSGSELCRTHKLNPNLLSRWRKEFIDRPVSLKRGHRIWVPRSRWQN